MLKNYFKTAWRSLMRHKIFTIINVAGLAIGISAALVIYLIVNYDFNFDHFEKDNDRIYRVVTDFNFSGVPYHNRGVVGALPQTVKREAVGVEDVVIFDTFDLEAKIEVPATGTNNPLLLKKQSKVIITDPSYFKLINYKWIEGSATDALNEPLKVVLTEERAKMYFPGLSNHDIIGRQVVYDDSLRTTVTGIVASLQENSDFIFHDFISLATLTSSTRLKKQMGWDKWTTTNGQLQLYVKLATGTSVPKFEKQLDGLYKKYFTPPPHANKYKMNYRLQPLSDLHFNKDYTNYSDRLAHKPTLYGLLLVASFLLLLACINFINLSTAQASQRAKEIGIRKTMGSSKAQLIFQFLGETFLVTIIAAIVSVILTPVLLKAFGDFIPPGVNFQLLQRPNVIAFLVLLIITVSLLSGFYPSWILSNYNAVLVLKNQAYANTGKTRKTWIRKSLTIFQFLVAQLFIMGTLIVAKQIHYTLNKDLGFKKDAIVTVSTPYSSKLANRRFVLMDKLKAIPEIEMVSLGGKTPATDNTSSGQVTYKDGKQEIQTDVMFKYGDINYLKLYHIPLVAGRNINPSDTVKEAIINETYAHLLGFKNIADAIGKSLEWAPVKLPIVGVIADFHEQSLHQEIKPLLFSAAANNSYDLHIALKPENADGTAWKNGLSKIEHEFKATYPETDFEYEFYDQSIAKFYKDDQNVSRLLQWATGLSVFISCLGLLGLVIYTTNLRTKEIGIRKVLGASVTNLVSILSTDFVKLVLVAFVIAAPIAWWGTTKWLQNFAYRTSINWWVFALSGLFMVIIALLTLSFQTVKAAIANPVKSLRSE